MIGSKQQKKYPNRLRIRFRVNTAGRKNKGSSFFLLCQDNKKSTMMDGVENKKNAVTILDHIPFCLPPNSNTVVRDSEVKI